MENKIYKLSDVELSIFRNLFKEKSGVYVWTNLTNGKRYVGSSNNLKRR